MSGRLIALEKKPGIRPVSVGETWRQLMAKCLLRMTGQESKDACSMDLLAGLVEEGIEGGIHAIHLLWEEHLQEEY